ncbi:hypothetical protein [Micromonospora sp. ATA51]|uniref:hypothetical protein n=1 Tax=Micromonospora sp. ATA51 TaxID=2806098 RepID=UPI001A543B5D|nr:hypothetical protein [Micromonospora sp. ATA51]MBM0224795.1 hypothetical protein [Micromonospora sp. ATA51]
MDEDYPPFWAVQAELIFADASGLRWTRIDNDGPRRWIDPTKPLWWVRALYEMKTLPQKVRGRQRGRQIGART